VAATLLVLDSEPGLEWALGNVEALSGIFISIQVSMHSRYTCNINTHTFFESSAF